MKDSSNQSIFHCHYQGCHYIEGSERYFTTKKNLKQHIAKVHAEKKYFCTKCQKGFSNDWFRKHHEKSCESKWQCSCGLKYQYRESLLTHFRRSQHVLPEDILPKKKPLFKPEKKENSPTKPLVIIIQPTVTYVPYKQTSAIESKGGARFILPKQPQPVLINLNATSPVADENNNGNKYPTANDNNLLSTFSSNTHAESLTTNGFLSRNNTFNKSVAETQTCDFLKNSKVVQPKRSLKHSESRGSQCSSTSKSKDNIKSACTQTMESAIVKMKKRYSKSRRKSVAVTTDSETFQPTQSLWSDLENFLFPKDSENKSDKYSSATQTSPGFNFSNKVLCDSQTLTDNFFQFPWSSGKEHELMDDSSFQTLTELSMDPSLTHSQVNSAPNDNLFSLKHSTPSNLTTSTDNTLDWLTKDSSICSNIPNNSESLVLSEGNSNSGETNNEIISSLFESCFPSVSDNSLKTNENINLEEQILNGNFPSNTDSTLSHSESLNTILNFSNSNNSQTLSNNHTQTTAIDNLDYANIFANMETQTSDDFLFSDLEFLDNETQTPWNDIQNDTLPVDQFSIEIQTDFSSFVSTYAPDFSLIPDVSVDDCNTDLDKVIVGRHMETQTQDVFKMPQVTNSEAQTLYGADCFYV